MANEFGEETEWLTIKTRIVQIIKRIVFAAELKSFVIDVRQRRIFRDAMDEFLDNPWAVLDHDSNVLKRLVTGWGNPSWSADHEYLQAIVNEFSRTTGPILECGSGLSTIVLGVLAAATNREVWTLEHSSDWASRVSRELDELQIDSVHICVKPLKNYDEYSWYDPPLESMPRDVALVVCDGPPGGGHGGRSGMLPIMKEYLADSVSVLLDDTIRSDEKEIAKDWAEALNATVIERGAEHPYAVIRGGRDDESIAGGDSQPLVTVGVPVFNGEMYLSQSLESVLSQTINNLLLLVSDNESTDSTQNQCMQYVNKDARVRYYRQKKNIGVFQNYNELARKSASKYFKWQSSSDWCDEGFVKVCVDVLDSDESVVLACPEVLLVDEAGKEEPYADDFGLAMDDPTERFRYLLGNIQLCNLFNGVIRTRALRGSKLNRNFLGSDVVLLAELALKGKFALIPDRLWHRRMTPSTASKLQSTEQRVGVFSGLPQAFDKHVTWKVTYSLFEIVFQSEIGLPAKLKCLAFLLRTSIWVRRDLWKELFHRS